MWGRKKKLTDRLLGPALVRPRGQARGLMDQRWFGQKGELMMSYYPERLAKCFILNMPWFFVSIWKMVSRFLEKATLEKIVMVTNEDERENFINEIGIEALPEEYGGQAKLTLIQDVKLTISEDSTPQIDEISHKC